MSIQYEINVYKAATKLEYQYCIYTTLVSPLEGEVELKFEKSHVSLKKGEIYLMNFGKLYSMEANEGAVVAIVRIKYEDILKASNKQQLRFYCDTYNDTSKDHYQLKKVFSSLLRYHVMGGRDFEEMSAFYNMMAILMKNYVRNSKEESGIFEDNKMNKVRLYLHTHFYEKISLEDICEQFHFSISTFTRNFKKETNQSMIQYLNSIRIQEAKKLLLDNDMSVTDIAWEVGFSDIATFNKLFKKVVGVSPLKFKQSIINEEVTNIENDTLLNMVKNTFIVESREDLIEDGKKIHRKNEITPTPLYQYNKGFTHAIGIEEASLLLNGQNQKNLLSLCKKLHVKYVRLPFLFTETLLQVKNNQFDFNHIDVILDFIIENHMIPLIELSGRKINVKTSGVDIEVEETNRYSLNDFKERVDCFLSHIFLRYSGSPVLLDDWIWEFQYNRDTYTLKEYVSLFDSFYKEIKKWNNKHQVGGYGVDLYDFNENEINSLFKYTFQPDFISINMYPYQCKMKKGKIKYLDRILTNHVLENEMIRLKECLFKIKGDGFPLYITNWNTTFEESDILNDSSVKSALIIDMASKLLNHADLFIYDSALDKNDQDRILYGGKGLISKDGLEKSVFNALMGLSYLSEKIVINDENLIMSYVKNNHYIGVCFNHKNFNMSYYQKSESSIKLEDISHLFDDMDLLNQELNLSDLSNGIYRIKLIRTSYDKSILTRIEELGQHVHLSFEEIQYLKKQDSYDLKLMEIETINNQLNFSLELKPNEMVLISIYPLQLNNE